MGIHNYDKKLKASLRRVREAEMLESNRTHIFNYYNFMLARGLSKSRIDRCLQVLKLFGGLVSKDFKELDKTDIIALVGEIESRDYSNWTKVSYKSILKNLIKWVHDCDEHPKLVSWIKINCKNAKRLPEDLLTVDEIKRLINACNNPRDKALIAMLYESGCRISELGNLLIKHVSFDDYGAVLMVNGKTGQRRVRIINSIPFLADWLNHHPYKDDPEKPLWITVSKCVKPHQIDYAWFRTVLKKVAKRAGVTKRVNPHAFRHARATHLATKLTEAQMKEYFGWTQSSKMASVYIHLSGRDVDKALLRINGIKIKEENKTKSMKLLNCDRCGHTNVPTNKFCGKCGLILDIKDALEAEKIKQNKDKLLNVLINDPEVKQLLIEKAKVLNG